MKAIMNIRRDKLLNDSEHGDLFYKKDGSDFKDLSELLVCNIAVDTIRQMYKGTIPNGLFNLLLSLTRVDDPILDNQLFKNSSSKVFNGLSLPCEHMKLNRMGKNSGYRLKLQNNEVGIVILLGSYWSPIENEFSHMKIELSPHFIAQRTPEEIQQYMDDCSKLFLEDSKPCGVAPHLCVDIQGWDIPFDIESMLTTRTNFIKKYTGIGDLKLEGLDNVVSTFNRTETVMVGKSTSLQLSMYRKDLEIVKRDTSDYYHEKWGQFTTGEHNPDKSVIRTEMRFHHSVVKQFSSGMDKTLDSYLQVSKHLNNLWKYALDTIRLGWGDNHVHPVWQYLYQDIEFGSDTDIRQELFKRKPVAKTDTNPIKRNIAMLVGNLISIHARSTIKPREITKMIRKSPALMKPLDLYFHQQLIDSSLFFQDVEQRILERRVSTKFGIAA